MNKIAVIEESNLDEKKKIYITEQFQDFYEIAEKWNTEAYSIAVRDELDTPTMEQARKARLYLAKKRIEIEKTRKELKEQSLREGQLIDKIAKGLKELIEPAETYLISQEKYIEIKIENEKKARKIKRLEALQPYMNQEPYNNMEGYFEANFDLLNMSDTAFDELLEGAKTNCEKIAEEKRKAEEERIRLEELERLRNERIELVKPYYNFFDDEIVLETLSEEQFTDMLEELKAKKAKYDEEQKRIIEENKRLKAEAEKREKQLLEQRKKMNEQLQKEKEAKEKAEKELRAKQEEQKRLEKEKIEKQKELEKQPDREKFMILINTLDNIEIPNFKTKEAIEIAENVKVLINKIKEYIKSKF